MCVMQSMPPTHAASKAADMPLGLSSMSQPTAPNLGPISSNIKSPALPMASSQDLRIPAAMHPPALRTLAFHEQSKELQGPTTMQPGASSLVMGQSERKSIDALCFNTAAMTVTAPASEESFHRLESDCRSSTSENSSVHAFEVCSIEFQPVLPALLAEAGYCQTLDCHALHVLYQAHTTGELLRDVL